MRLRTNEVVDRDCKLEKQDLHETRSLDEGVGDWEFWTAMLTRGDLDYFTPPQG